MPPKFTRFYFLKKRLKNKANQPLLNNLSNFIAYLKKKFTKLQIKVIVYR